jgi:hypothetical protein
MMKLLADLAFVLEQAAGRSDEVGHSQHAGLASDGRSASPQGGVFSALQLPLGELLVRCEARPLHQRAAGLLPPGAQVPVGRNDRGALREATIFSALLDVQICRSGPLHPAEQLM